MLCELRKQPGQRRPRALRASRASQGLDTLAAPLALCRKATPAGQSLRLTLSTRPHPRVPGQMQERTPLGSDRGAEGLAGQSIGCPGILPHGPGNERVWVLGGLGFEGRRRERGGGFLSNFHLGVSVHSPEREAAEARLKGPGPGHTWPSGTPSPQP